MSISDDGRSGDPDIPETTEPTEPTETEALEAQLRALGERLGASGPPPAEVALAVRARLENADAPITPAHRPGWRQGWRPRWWIRRPSPRLAAALVAVLVSVLLGATPQGRAAVVSVLRFAGVEIHVGGVAPLPTGLPGPLPGERRVTLAEARGAVRFPVVVPSALGEPADVRVADGGRVVTLLWPGIRLDEYDGTLTVVWHKELGEPWPEQVSAVDGWWISRNHGVSYVSAQGRAREERVAGPTLIWQHGLVGLRLEGPGRDEALRIASSVR
ncbi:hypothetical protein [Microbispora amethystogenes]|uniref:DUF4367 domain-containing protein n=1 Tax=Microbispora amethystogenes TaxID=1427754 RepID=A0ABQ4F7S5_9ACTN|nr:hypothetical protein [Microbispora amethystogenes]GIH30865.1 hypothetical protein Mam01_10290 [Microbispora amethystogenes]